MMRARLAIGAAVGVFLCLAGSSCSGSTSSVGNSPSSSGASGSGSSGSSGTSSSSSGGSGSSGASSSSSGSSGASSSSSGSSGTSSGGTDAGTDAPPGDGDLCSNIKCTGTDVCCAVPVQGGVTGKCMASCPNGEPPVTCDGPEECPGQVCCGTTTTGPGTFPSCPVVTASASCVNDCQNSIAFSCSATSTARRCHVKADCTSDPQNPLCCTFQSGGQTLAFCTSQLIATGGGGTCL